MMASSSPYSPPSNAKYMGQLDAVRAFAVLAVIFFHFLQFGQESALPLGMIGVTTFFVLSGFLITGILLRCRENVVAGASPKEQLKVFYARRFLRIFPLYYAVVIIGALVGLEGMRESFSWNVTYTSNIYYALKHGWGGADSHFWSLAVEEQFYLLWPLVVLLLPESALLPAIAFSWGVALVFRGVSYEMGANGLYMVLTVARLDALAAGALLALLQSRRSQQFQQMTNSRWYNCAAFGLLVLFFGASSTQAQYPAMRLVENAIFPLLAFWFVHRAAVGFTGTTGRLLQTKMLSDCGKISYGLYVFHPFVRALLPAFMSTHHLPYPQNPGTEACLEIVVSVAVATASWHVMEKPLNDLKKHFPYFSRESRTNKVSGAEVPSFAGQ